MREFNSIDPDKVEQDSRVILKITEFAEELNRDHYYFLLRDGEHLIWAIKSFFPQLDGNPAYWSGGNILEFPIKGLPWFIETLEQQFFKTEAEGGLPKGKFAYEEIIDGERLCVSRMFGEPGYGFRNYSRQDHVIKSYECPQQADLSDELLFKNGLFEEFKKIALKIESGNP